MDQTRIWTWLLGGLALIAFGYTLFALVSWHHYSRLNQQAPVQSIEWSALPASRGKFVLEAHYRFRVGNKNYQNQTVLSSLLFWNEQAALAYREDASREYAFVWFQKDYPERSSLVKQLPWKALVTALFMWGLLLYFFWVKARIKAYQGN